MKNESINLISETLADLLAETDAVNSPCRKQITPASQANVAAKFEFHEKGLPYRKAGNNKTRFELLAKLEGSGHVTVRRERGRATHWKLTDSADEILRAAVAMPGRESCKVVMRRLVHLADAGDYVEGNHGERLVRETELGEFFYTNDDQYFAAVEKLQDALLLGLVRRWIGYTLACGYGARNSPLAYCVTTIGEAALRSPAATPRLPRRNAELQDFYQNRFVDHSERLAASKPKDENCIYIAAYVLSFQTVNELRAGTSPAEQKANLPHPAARKER